MITLLKAQAIQIALTGNWEMAIAINQEILKETPEDIDALNRLAFAYSIIGKSKLAKEAYQKVLAIDSCNPIALKNLKKLGESTTKKMVVSQLMSTMFLEESGKTKIVSLINTAQPKILRTLQIGQMLNLSIKRLKIFVIDGQGQFIGMLPDDIGTRLIKFLDGGNEYETCIKAVEDHKVVVFMREMKRANKFKNLPSFLLGDKTHLAFKQKQKDKDYEDLEPLEEEA